MKRLYVHEVRLPITLKDCILKLRSLSANPGGIFLRRVNCAGERESRFDSQPRGGGRFRVVAEKEMLSFLNFFLQNDKA